MLPATGFPFTSKRCLDEGIIRRQFNYSTSWKRAHTSESYPTPFPRSVPGCAKRKTLTQRRGGSQRKRTFTGSDGLRSELQSLTMHNSRSAGVRSIRTAAGNCNDPVNPVHPVKISSAPHSDSSIRQCSQRPPARDLISLFSHR